MSTEDDDLSLLGVPFKWEGPLDARKIVERTRAAIIAGLFMGVGFYLSTVVGGLF